jgi:hypothetical protein
MHEILDTSDPESACVILIGLVDNWWSTLSITLENILINCILITICFDIWLCNILSFFYKIVAYSDKEIMGFEGTGKLLACGIICVDY